jgi:hypothetical protein
MPWDAVTRTALCADVALIRTLPGEPQQEKEHEKGGEHLRKCSDSKTWTLQTEKRTDGKGNGLGKWSVISTRFLHRCEKDEGWKDLKRRGGKMRFLMLLLRTSGFQCLRQQRGKQIHRLLYAVEHQRIHCLLQAYWARCRLLLYHYIGQWRAGNETTKDWSLVTDLLVLLLAAAALERSVAWGLKHQWIYRLLYK